MDARTETQHIPLCVDLDGTLLAADTLWEGAAIILLRNPLMAFAVLLKGKARLKYEVAARSRRQAADWPYREAVLKRLTRERETGRQVILVTGAAENVALRVAAHTGVFSSVLHSTTEINLTSRRKRDKLIEQFGEGGFEVTMAIGASHVLADALGSP